MNVEQLLMKHCDGVVDSPEAISRLRKFILNLAVRGRLVEQDPDDEPVENLLARIRKEKQKLIDSGELRKQKVYSDNLVETLSILPISWKWVAIGDIFLYDAGIKRDPETLDTNSWLLELEDIEKDSGRLLKRVRVRERDAKSTKSEFKTNDILYGKLRPYLNKVLVADQCGYSTTEIVSIRPYLPICSKYCALALRRSDFVKYVNRLGQGTKMPRLRTEDAKVAAFPLPPLAEQHRIVAKVDELMDRCDRLDEKFKEREDHRKQFTKASFGSLTESGMDQGGFKNRSGFVVKNFDRLTLSVEQIKGLRKLILELAVRGRLVKQDLNDEPASELLKRISYKKKHLVELGELRIINKLPQIDQWPHPLPENWSWTRIREVCTDRGQKVPDSNFTYIDVTAIDKELGRVCNPKVLSASEAPSRARKIVRKGDVIYSCVRPYLLNIAVVEEDFNPLPIVSTAFAVLNGHKLVAPRYIWIVLRSSFFVGLVQEKQRGQSYPAINESDFAMLLFPLPPLAEQHRIVARVDELMLQCEELEERIEQQEELRKRVFESYHTINL